MNGLPAGLCMLMDTPQGDRQPGLRMLDGRDRPARLAFECGISWRHAAWLDRWLAIFWPQPPGGAAARVIWLLDASTVRWSGGMAGGRAMARTRLLRSGTEVARPSLRIPLIRLVHPGSYRRGMNNELSATVRRPFLARPVTEPEPGAQDAQESNDLRVSIRPGPLPVIEVHREIGVWSGRQLRDQLLWMMRRHGAWLALDLGGVTFIDCAGIGALLATRRRAELDGRSVRIVRVSPRVRRILALANVQQVLISALPHSRSRRLPQAG
jgi:anti-anti-sigma factor